MDGLGTLGLSVHCCTFSSKLGTHTQSTQARELVQNGVSPSLAGGEGRSWLWDGLHSYKLYCQLQYTVHITHIKHVSGQYSFIFPLFLTYRNSYSSYVSPPSHFPGSVSGACFVLLARLLSWKSPLCIRVQWFWNFFLKCNMLHVFLFGLKILRIVYKKVFLNTERFPSYLTFYLLKKVAPPLIRVKKNFFKIVHKGY
jgi:hypothetical protein